jgi:hypothetical protein
MHNYKGNLNAEMPPRGRIYAKAKTILVSFAS